jgi:hypothetical protein
MSYLLRLYKRILTRKRIRHLKNVLFFLCLKGANLNKGERKIKKKLIVMIAIAVIGFAVMNIQRFSNKNG